MGKLSKGEIIGVCGKLLIKVSEHLEDDETPDELDIGEIADLVMTVVTELKQELEMHILIAILVSA